MSDLADLRRDLARLVDLEPVQYAIGDFGKDTAHEVVETDLGSDRAFSGWKSKVRLGAGYDLGNPVILNLRAAGMWYLADKGRKRTKRITPKKRSGKKALRTPHGPRASSTSGRSRGHRTLITTQQRIEQGIVRAAEQGVNEMIKKAGF